MSVTVTATVGPSGRMLVVVFRDAASPTGATTNLGPLGTGATISVNGGAAIALANPIWGADTTHTPPVPYLPFVIYPLATAIGPADVVTMSFPDTWATTRAGAVPAATIQVVNDSGGTLLPTFDPSAVTMRVGANVYAPIYWGVENTYANIIKQGSGSPTFDADLNPTTFPASVILATFQSGGGDPLGYANVPADGIWTLIWDGDYNANLTLNSGSTLVNQLMSDVRAANNIGHTRTYRITVDPTVRHAPTVRLAIAAAGYANPRVYPPDEATDGSQLFATNLVRKANGYQCIRFMQALATDPTPVVEFADFAATNQFTFMNNSGPIVGGTVASLDPYTPPDNFLDPADCQYVVTFAAPHGAQTGQILAFNAPIPSPNGDGTFPTTNGGTTHSLGNALLLVRAIDSLRLAASVTTKAGAGPSGGTLTQSYPMTGVTFTTRTRGMMPPEHCADFSNVVGADCWVNVPHAASDACVTTMAQRIAATLRPGLKCYVELSNEHWNTGLHYEQFWYFKALGRTMPGSGATATATVNGSGVLTGLTLVNPGTGYGLAPTVTIAASPSGVGADTAKAHATLIGGTLALVLEFGGHNYDPFNPPTVTLDPAVSNTAAYTWRAAHVHGLFAAAFAAAGRGGDLVRIMGGQYMVSGGPTHIIATTAARNGITFDALCVAPYFSNVLRNPGEPTMAAPFDLLDEDQLHDVSQVILLYGNFMGNVVGHRTELDAAGFTGVAVVFYEAGPEDGCPYGSVNVTPSQSTRAFAWSRHPRMRDLMLAMLKMHQDNGVSLYVDYLLSYIIDGRFTWATFFGREQVPGLGDGSDGLFDNRTAYQDMSRVVSVKGRAQLDWLSRSVVARSGRPRWGGGDPARPIPRAEMRQLPRH